MKQLRITKYLALIVTVFTSAVYAEDYAQSYRNSAVYQMYSKEQIEEQRAAELEQRAMAEKDRLERQKREAEAEIAASRYRIEGIKMRQDKATQDLDTVSTDLQAIKEQISSVQAEHKETQENAKATLEYLATVQKDLQTRQVQLSEETQALTTLKRKAEQSIFEKGVEMERMKVEVAKAQTRIEDLRAQAANISAREMQVRTEWMQNKMQVAEYNRQKAEAMANLHRTNKELNKAQRELGESRQELAKAENTNRRLQARVRDDMAMYERQIAAANRAKINAEAEKIRIDSEIQKTREYAARLQDKRDQAFSERDEAKGVVMQSTLALESARSELSQVAESRSKEAYREMRREAQARGLAAASKAYQMVDGARPFVLNNKCNGYRKPASEGDASGSYEPGNKIFARPAGSAWVEVINGSGGKSTFVESRCGRFEN